MKNKWKIIEEDDARLYDKNHRLIAHIFYSGYDWWCKLYINNIAIEDTILTAATNLEEAIYEGTMWVYEFCLRMKLMFDRIIGELPDFYDVV